MKKNDKAQEDCTPPQLQNHALLRYKRIVPLYTIIMNPIATEVKLEPVANR